MNRHSHPARKSIRVFPLILVVVAFLAACSILAIYLSAQEYNRPLLKVDDDCTAFAFSPDDRIAYSVQHLTHTKKYDLERDDIWITTLKDKKRRIIEGLKFAGGPNPFSYLIRDFAWSPDAHTLAIEMSTIEATNDKGGTNSEEVVHLIGDDGHDIGSIHNAFQPGWSSDNDTLFYLSEEVKPKVLFSIKAQRALNGLTRPILEGHVFAAIAWDPKHDAAVAIEHDQKLSGPMWLVLLDLDHQTEKQLGTIERFAGGLTVSPSGTKFAYFRDNETLEIHDIAPTGKVTIIRALIGTYAWAPDENRILLKPGPSKDSNEISWVQIPGGQFQPILNDLTFRDFAISPDGKYIGVTEPGKRALNIYQTQ